MAAKAKSASDDLYRMADGTAASAGEVAEDENGVLRHKETGVHVTLNSEGEPMTLAEETASQQPQEEAEDEGEPKPTATKPAVESKTQTSTTEAKKEK